MNLVALVAARMRELRRRHALTQIECAELVGMDYKFFQKLESARKKQIWLETVERLSKAFGLEVWEFLAPELPVRTTLSGRVAASNAHCARRRGPYDGASRVSPRKG